MSRDIFMLGADSEPTPVRIVESRTSFWQSIAVFVGALASLATLYSVYDRKKGRR